MAAAFQGLWFLALGTGLLMVDYHALSSGWLPCGSNWLKGRLKFRKVEQPFRFWSMFVAYGVLGIWSIVFALQLLFGHATPLPWR